MKVQAAGGSGERSGWRAPIVIQEQGSFAVGGTVVRHLVADNAGQETEHTLHGDHAYVSYQVPVHARKYPLAFLHGHLQFAKTWETTPDGREGFHNIFLRRGFGVYQINQPRRGNAGQSTAPHSLAAVPEDQTWFNVFRVGIWPNYFPGVLFARDAETLNQYLRQMTPYTGPFDVAVSVDAVSAFYERRGPGILITHSQGGGIGWLAAIRSANIRSIISYEPGSNFPFPEGEVPDPIPSSEAPLEALGVSLPEFMQLTRIPIKIFYGDYIPAEPCDNPGQDLWRVRLEMARLWADAVNRHGGDVSVVHLPEAGIHGNTHFPFSDLNNVEIADLLSQFLADKELD